MRKPPVPKNPMVFQSILQHMNWSGTRLVFPYWVGSEKFTATIYLRDVYRIIRWEKHEDTGKMPVLREKEALDKKEDADP